MRTYITKPIICSLLTLFAAVPVLSSEVKCYYWFDSETDLSQATTTTFSGNRINLNIDAKSLPYGLHKISVMVESSDKFSPALCRLFYKPEPIVENVNYKLRINVDGSKLYDKNFSSPSEIVTLDVSQLPVGLHKLDCVITSSDGMSITTGQNLFYKPAPEMSRDDWEMTFFANDSQLWNGELPEGDDVVLLDTSSIKGGITQLLCLFTSTQTGESFVAEKKDFYKPSDTPNSISGYMSEAGSEYVGQNVSALEYSIEMENSSNADAEPINSVEVTGSLDPAVFNLSSFSMKGVRIGGKYLSLNGRKSFHERLDLRPERDAIADIICNFNESTGNLTWSVTSLDPGTSGKTDDKAHGFLPANTDGWGMAEIFYDIKLNADLSDGTSIDNAVTLSFDDAQVATPSWHNILDLSLPISSINSVEETAGGYEFDISGTDVGSGIWKYELYRKDKGEDKWNRVMSDIIDTHFVYLTENTSDTPQFATVAIDKAGNVEISAIMNSGIEDVPNDAIDGDKDYYSPIGIKVPEEYNGIVITKGRKILKTNQSTK